MGELTWGTPLFFYLWVAGMAGRGGYFSAYDPAKRSYDKSKWAYQVDEEKIPIRAESLDDPNCVFAKLKEQYDAYDLETEKHFRRIMGYKSLWILEAALREEKEVMGGDQSEPSRFLQAAAA